MKKRMIALGAMLVSATIASPVVAQQAAPQGNAPQTQQSMQQALPDASQFSEKQLDAFAAAQKEMGAIQQEYSKKLQGKKDQPEEAVKVKQEAQQEMAKAVQDSGLELNTYNQIVRLAQYDADFRNRIVEKMQ